METATEEAIMRTSSQMTTELEQVFTSQPPPSQEEIEEVVSKEAELASSSDNPPVAIIEPTKRPLLRYTGGYNNNLFEIQFFTYRYPVDDPYPL